MKITKEQAAKEVNKWLDYKKISDRKKEKHNEHIENLIDSVCDGYLVFNEDQSIKQILKFPIEGEQISITEITFKPRLKVSSIAMHMNGVKAGDINGTVCAYICALTSTAKGIIQSFDTEDYEISSSIGIFFL